MTMGRFILRFRGQGPLPDDIVRQVRQLPETQILEETDRMLLVEGPEEPLRRLVNDDWLFTQEQRYTPPERRPTIKG